MKKIVIGLSLVLIAVATTGVYHLTQRADICYYQGHDLFVRSQYKASIPFFLESISYDPKRAKALSELAYAYLWSGNHQEAIKVFQRLLLMDPGSLRVRRSLASAYSWNKEYERAEALFLEVLRVNKGDREAQKELAEVYIWDQKFDKSKTILKALIQSDPRDVRAKFLYGKALLYSGQTKEASRIFEELLTRPRTAAGEVG